MDTYTLINYFDNWKDEEDSWIVNNAYVEADDVVITDDATDEDIINYLYQNEYVKVSEPDCYCIENDGDFIEIFDSNTMEPLFGLVKKYETEERRR